MRAGTWAYLGRSAPPYAYFWRVSRASHAAARAPSTRAAHVSFAPAKCALQNLLLPLLQRPTPCLETRTRTPHDLCLLLLLRLLGLTTLASLTNGANLRRWPRAQRLALAFRAQATSSGSWIRVAVTMAVRPPVRATRSGTSMARAPHLSGARSSSSRARARL